MTRDEVMAMSNQELRAEIAKELGWILDKNSLSWVGSFVVNKGSPSDNIPDEYECSAIPDWPNDIKAAWGLAEDWREQGEVDSLSYKASDFSSRSEGLRQSCYLRMSDIYVEAETTPLAISRAWLIWKNESEK